MVNAEALRSEALRVDPRQLGVLFVDGRSGSGKTTFADSVVADLIATGARPQVLRVEDLYPGWDGLGEGSLAVAEALETGEYLRYDWLAGAFAERRSIAPRTPLVIEGCGAITRANLAAAGRWAERCGGPAGGGAVRSVWLDCPEPVRRARALARDGETYAPHWERWAAQERAHYAEHEPWRLADEAIAPR